MRDGKIVYAEVAELVDALGSGLSGCMPVRVRLPSSAPHRVSGAYIPRSHASGAFFLPSLFRTDLSTGERR